MKIWTIWLQVDDATWLEAAWDDDTTAENRSGWEEAVEKAKAAAAENDGEMRMLLLDVPDRDVFGAFQIPEVAATVSEANEEAA